MLFASNRRPSIGNQKGARSTAKVDDSFVNSAVVTECGAAAIRVSIRSILSGSGAKNPLVRWAQLAKNC
jgi:hypothetical protein